MSVYFQHWGEKVRKDVLTLAKVYVRCENMTGNHVWTVGAYLYRGALFDSLTDPSIRHDCLASAPLHRGCTFSEWAYNSDGSVAYKCFACDYAHHEDDAYEAEGTEKHGQAMGIFRDRNELAAWILSWENKE